MRWAGNARKSGVPAIRAPGIRSSQPVTPAEWGRLLGRAVFQHNCFAVVSGVLLVPLAVVLWALIYGVLRALILLVACLIPAIMSNWEEGYINKVIDVPFDVFSWYFWFAALGFTLAVGFAPGFRLPEMARDRSPIFTLITDVLLFPARLTHDAIGNFAALRVLHRGDLEEAGNLLCVLAAEREIAFPKLPVFISNFRRRERLLVLLQYTELVRISTDGGVSKLRRGTAFEKMQMGRL